MHLVFNMDDLFFFFFYLEKVKIYANIKNLSGKCYFSFIHVCQQLESASKSFNKAYSYISIGEMLHVNKMKPTVSKNTTVNESQTHNAASKSSLK